MSRQLVGMTPRERRELQQLSDDVEELRRNLRKLKDLIQNIEDFDPNSYNYIDQNELDAAMQTRLGQVFDIDTNLEDEDDPVWLEIIDKGSMLLSGIQFTDWAMGKLFGSSYTNLRNSIVSGVQNAARDAGQRVMDNLRGVAEPGRYQQLVEVTDHADDLVEMSGYADEVKQIAGYSSEIVEVAQQAGPLKELASHAETLGDVASGVANVANAGAKLASLASTATDIAEVVTGVKTASYGMIGLAGIAGLSMLLSIVDANSDELPKMRHFRNGTLKRLEEIELIIGQSYELHDEDNIRPYRVTKAPLSIAQLAQNVKNNVMFAFDCTLEEAKNIIPELETETFSTLKTLYAPYIVAFKNALERNGQTQLFEQRIKQIVAADYSTDAFKSAVQTQINDDRTKQPFKDGVDSRINTMLQGDYFDVVVRDIITQTIIEEPFSNRVKEVIGEEEYMKVDDVDAHLLTKNYVTQKNLDDRIQSELYMGLSQIPNYLRRSLTNDAITVNQVMTDVQNLINDAIEGLGTGTGGTGLSQTEVQALINTAQLAFAEDLQLIYMAKSDFNAFKQIYDEQMADVATEQYVIEQTANFATMDYVQAQIQAISGGGTTDLTNYYNKTEVDNKFGPYYTKVQADNLFQTKEWLVAKFAQYLPTTEIVENFALKTDISNYDNAIAFLKAAWKYCATPWFTTRFNSDPQFYTPVTYSNGSQSLIPVRETTFKTAIYENSSIGADSIGTGIWNGIIQTNPYDNTTPVTFIKIRGNTNNIFEITETVGNGIFNNRDEYASFLAQEVEQLAWRVEYTMTFCARFSNSDKKVLFTPVWSDSPNYSITELINPAAANTPTRLQKQYQIVATTGAYGTIQYTIRGKSPLVPFNDGAARYLGLMIQNGTGTTPGGTTTDVFEVATTIEFFFVPAHFDNIQ